ncbi:MAG: hypothetical protein H6827_09675 [Planctomycetes bacterium]|nr:hypothetical protein [Planctomycetota bacterium]
MTIEAAKHLHELHVQELSVQIASESWFRTSDDAHRLHVRADCMMFAKLKTERIRILRGEIANLERIYPELLTPFG